MNLIRLHIIAEKLAEVFDDEFSQGLHIKVLADERREGSQEAVSERFTIDTTNDVSHR